MLKQLKGSLFCFSPPVMIATFLIEIIFVIYIVWRYKLNTLAKLAILMLTFLAIFQLAEFMICEGYGFNTVDWARIGYFSITLLPALGVHLMLQIAGVKKSWLPWIAYATMIPFIIYFVFATEPFRGEYCLGNYVIFHIPGPLVGFYSAYYYLWLAVATLYSWRLSLKSKNKKIARALKVFAIGYVAFIAPTITVNLLKPETASGIPSIMCGFAVLMAIAVTLGVMPLVGKNKPV